MSVRRRPKIFAGRHWNKVLENLEVAENCYKNKNYNASVSRSYYALYQTLATILISNGHFRETRKHPTVIYDFHQNYVIINNTDDEDEDIYKIIPENWNVFDTVMTMQNYRHLADYESFGITEEECKEILDKVSILIKEIVDKFKNDENLKENFKEVF